MKKPTPQDYGLTDEEVQRLSEVDDRRKRTHDRALSIVWALLFFPCWLVCWIGATAYFLSRPKSLSDGDIIRAVLLVALPSACIVNFFFEVLSIKTVVSRVVERVLQFITIRRHNNFIQYLQYRNAQAEYLKWYKEFLKWYERTQYEFWSKLDGWAFEREVARLLKKLGYGTTLTSGSNDKGVDLFLDDGTVVQCKAHKNPVSPAVVRELYGTMTHFEAPRAILVSLNGFTRGVIDFVQDKRIELWDVDDLISLQKELGGGIGDMSALAQTAGLDEALTL